MRKPREATQTEETPVNLDGVSSGLFDFSILKAIITDQRLDLYRYSEPAPAEIRFSALGARTDTSLPSDPTCDGGYSLRSPWESSIGSFARIVVHCYFLEL
ncbi:hypothetical protein QN277_001269 [Acacia crassicarpa]|uniref:Uncharacterized protein n=1 Tax=Acacia crassicarpa TaxID=499986 RepID=A0AAE1N893_9FABA|nr:hypothetical protein QN277_001269 [Acacia crassicarpa]